MLTENDVVQAVAEFLRTGGFRIEGTASTRDHGPDIVARHELTGVRMFVEAKGATSSKNTSRRFGKVFTPSQAISHVSRAFYHAAKLRQLYSAESAQVALAFPSDVNHHRLVDDIRAALDVLGIDVFLVDADGTVSHSSCHQTPGD